MKTKYICICMMLAFLGVVIACTESTEEKAKPIEIIFSTYWPTSYDYLLGPINNFTENVEKESKGRIKFKLYHSGQLYKGKEEFAAVERGDIDMSAPLDIYNTGIVPELGIGSLPFMWGSPDSLQKTLDAGLWDLGINQALSKHNMVVLGIAAAGPYQVYSKDFSVISSTDMKGKKWAVSGSTASKAVELLGGAPTTMSSGELYLALQRGTIDGTTRPLITGIGRKLYEVVGNLSITNLAYFSSFLVINKKKWDSIPKELQDIMKEAAKIRSQDQLRMLKVFMDKAVSSFKEKGVKVHMVSQDELAKFKSSMSPVYDWWLSKVPDGKKYIDFTKSHH